MRQTQSKFNKGVNRRFPIEEADNPNRLYNLQNARLFARGTSNFVSRIKGYQQLQSNAGDLSFDVIHDCITYKDSIVVLWHDTTNDLVRITIKGIDTGDVEQFSFTDEQAEYGKLVLQEDYIYLSPYNKQLNNIDDTWYLNDFISTTPLLETYLNGEGELRVNETFWYTVRYIFQDGHITKTAFPKRIDTTSTENEVGLTIEAVQDLDGSFADIEIFRKRNEENFFKIDRVRPTSSSYTYLDDGKSRLTILEDRNYIWSKDHRSHDIVRNRYVRANLEYNNPDYDTNGTTAEGVDLGPNETDGAIFNSSLEVFAKPRFNDGTESFFKSVGRVNFNEDNFPDGSVSNYGIEIDQNEFTDDVKEVGYYGKYDITDPNFAQEFNTFEIYNQNVADIPTFGTETENKPTDTHIFLGWRYIARRVWQGDFGGGGTDTAEHIVVDEDWDTVPSPSDVSAVDDSVLLERVDTESDINLGTALPFTIEVNVMGRQLTYFRVAASEFNTNYNGGSNYDYYQGVYELGIFNSLVSAANLGALSISLNNDTNNTSLSSEITNSEYEQAEVPIKSIFDTSIEPFRLQEHTENGSVNPPASSRVYAVIDGDSIYGQFDNTSFSRFDAKFDFDSFNGGQFGYQFMHDNPEDYPVNFAQDFQASFKINNIQPFEAPQTLPDSMTDIDASANGFNTYTIYEYEWKHTIFDPSVFLNNDQVIYFGSIENGNEQNVQLDTLGYTKTEQDGIVFYDLNEFNIYETLISQEDLEDFEGNFPTQIIWSAPITLQTNAQGIRNFRFSNVKNISQDYGEILDIQYINNVLLVFCERGVNMINVGEVQTQQGDGDVNYTFVGDSQFLTNDRWILKNLNDIKPDSIVQYENLLFFCDGLDVWMYENGFKNITNGAIEFDEINNYEGVIDPYNKEYRITEGTQTWAYSLEIGEWFGPYTYSMKNGTNYRERLFGVPDQDLCEFEIGNDFDGQTYETIVESVSKDLEEDSIDKLWRKFYLDYSNDELDTSTVEFRYGRDYGDWTANDLENRDTKNGVYHIGIAAEHQNSKDLFWGFTTSVKDFVVRLVSANFSIRKRR